jgi:hypothetical protein
VQDEISGDHPFWKDPRARVAELDPARVVLLGDFGPGSDAPLILDYAADASGPTVRRLRWNPDGSTQWVLVSNTFEEFLAALGL